MRSSLPRILCTLLVVAAAVACDSSPRDPGGLAADDGLDETAAAGEVKLAVDVVNASVPLGDEIVFRFHLTNDGSAPVSVNVPRIDIRSATFRVRQGTDIAQIRRNHSELAGSPTGQPMLKPTPNVQKEIAPGETFVHEVKTYALAVGEATYTPQYAYTPAGIPIHLTAKAIPIDVTPKDGKSKLGVEIKTSHGDLVARLRPDLAFNTVESFVSLASAGFFDGLSFHRILPGFMAQGGDPKGTGEGGPGYFLPLEAHTKLLHNRGILSMARTGHPDTAGSQFFLMFTRYPSLDPRGPRTGYTVFGETIEGDATLTRLEAIADPRGQGTPTEKSTIQKITVVALD